MVKWSSSQNDRILVYTGYVGGPRISLHCALQSHKRLGLGANKWLSWACQERNAQQESPRLQQYAHLDCPTSLIIFSHGSPYPQMPLCHHMRKLNHMILIGYSACLCSSLLARYPSYHGFFFLLSSLFKIIPMASIYDYPPASNPPYAIVILWRVSITFGLGWADETSPIISWLLTHRTLFHTPSF